MKKILLIFISIILYSCGPCQNCDHIKPEIPPSGYTFIQKYNVVGTAYYIFEYNGCQYFGKGNEYDPRDLQHLGNCPNPIHIYNKVDTTELSLNTRHNYTSDQLALAIQNKMINSELIEINNLHSTLK